jgi:hypothetical protein
MDERADEASACYKKAAESEFRAAQATLAISYRFGDGVEKNDDEALKLLKAAATAKHVTAMTNLASMLHMLKESTESAKWYKDAADSNCEQAQLNYGCCCLHGTGTDKNLEEAFRYFKLSAEQGRADAQFNCGVCCFTGSGVAKDEAEACRWYKLAADQGDSNAQFALGYKLMTGTGVAQDEKAAIALYEAAAAQGQTDAIAELGACKMEGKGIEKDEAGAVEMFKVAAKRRHSGAMMNLGNCYRDGTGGLEANEEEAKQLLGSAEQVGVRRTVEDVVLTEDPEEE